MIIKRRGQQGFALPTVLIVSVILFTVLTVSVGAINSVNRSLDTQMNNRFVAEANESGLAMAQYCLEANNYDVTWTDAKPLRPWTNCQGNSYYTDLSACPETSTDRRCYVLMNGNMKTTFEVKSPVTVPNDASGSQTVSIAGKLAMTRATSGATYRSYASTSKAVVGGVAAAQDIAFGYDINTPGGENDVHAFFVTITGDGKMRGAGYNGDGQLGNGTLDASVTVPREAKFPAGVVPVKTFVYMKSQDRNIFALGSNNKMYTTGANEGGYIGRDDTGRPESMFKEYQLPIGDEEAVAGVAGPAKNVGQVGLVLTKKNNVYSAGSCTIVRGLNACATNPTTVSTRPTRVGLPAYDGTPNKTPTENIVMDGDVVFVRMKGGAVYGWGGNICGNLGQNDFVGRHGPTRIPGFGDPGQPVAVQIDTSGDALYIRDADGAMWSLGCNGYGQLGSTGAVLKSEASPAGTERCADIQWGSSNPDTPMWIWDCTRGDAQQWTFDNNGAIRNVKRNLCMDIWGGPNNVGMPNGNKVQTYYCSGAINQRWTMGEDGSIRSDLNPNKCLDIQDGRADREKLLHMWDCNGGPQQKWRMLDQPFPLKMNLPAGAKALDFSTDYGSISVAVDTNSDNSADDVYSVGLNHKGQFGDNNPRRIQPRMVRFQLPAGVKPLAKKDSTGTIVSTAHVEFRNANVFVIGDNGCVYGAGNNTSGQLGRGGYSTDRFVTPQKMNMPCDAKLVRSGGGTTAVITNSGYVYTMGDNKYGQVGSEKHPPAAFPYVSEPQLGRYTNPKLPIIF